ncbi:MAG: hypothetical protein ACOWWH_05470 [Eubacteriaceae bacterium]
MKYELNRNNFSFINIIKLSTTIFKNNIYEISFLTSLSFLAYSLLYIYLGDGTIESLMSIPIEIVILIYVLFLFSFLIPYPMLIHMVNNAIHNEKSSTKQLLKSLKKVFIKLIRGLLLLAFIIVATLFLITILVDIFYPSTILISILSISSLIIILKLFIDYIFYFQSIILHNSSPLVALKYSKKITKKNWWNIFYYYCSLSIIMFLLLNVLSLIITFLFPILIVYSTILAFFQSLSFIFTQIFITVMFLEINHKNKFPLE